MRKQLLNLALFGFIFLFTSCFGQHNNAPNPGVNLGSKRIYGERGAEPRQLKDTYSADDGTVTDRIVKMRDKLYPAKTVEELPSITLDNTSVNYPPTP